MPAPSSAAVFPFVIVKPLIVTLLFEAIRNTRLAALPLMARLGAPGPDIVTFLFTMSWAVVKVIVPVTEKLIVSPSLAIPSASRNDPGPLSLVLVTVMISADTDAGTATMHNSARKPASAFILAAIFVFIQVGNTC